MRTLISAHAGRLRQALLTGGILAAGALAGCGNTPVPSLHTQTTPPSNGAVAFDGARGVIVLVTQGSTAAKALQTWTWDGQMWTLQSPGSGPASRADTSIAYDAQRRVTVLYGGVSSAGHWLSDTWEWDGARWRPRPSAHIPPPTQPGFALTAYDPIAHIVLLYQWSNVSPSNWVNQTWAWNGRDWMLMRPAHTPPQIGGTLAFDGQRVILIGDTSDGDRSETWGWTGSDWSLLATSGFRGYAGAPAAFDQRHGMFIAFGGGPGDDTWIWDGSNWSRAHPQHSPDAAPQSLVYDPSLKAVVGFAGVGPITGVYRWTGQDWSAIGSAGRAVRAGGNVMTLADADSLIRQTVTATHPILLPRLPAGVDQAWGRADQNEFSFSVANDDRSIQVGFAIVVPGNSNLGAANENIAFRGTSAYYQYIKDDPKGWRDLWWTERPGHWTGEPGLKGGDGVPYVLSANGLSEADFFAMAASLS